MRKIKVFSIFGAHQIYQEIANSPPEGVEYIGISKQTTSGRYYQNKKWKERINNITQKLSLPRMIFIKPSNKYELIHTSRGIIPIQLFSNKPWVMDIEYFASFTGLHFDLMVKNKILKKFVENRLASKNCKKIICHCEATRQSFFKYINCSKFKDKLEVVYPSSHTIPLKKRKSNKIIILSVLSLFEQKGGPALIRTFSKLNKKYKNIKLILKSDVSEDLKRKYSNQNIEFIPYSKNIVPREELIKTLYSQADIFIYPTFCDSFGYSLIDASVAGLPIITTNLFASTEIVKDGENGLIVNIPGYKKENYIQEYPLNKMSSSDWTIFEKDMQNAIEKLICNKNLRQRMAQKSNNNIYTGNFSLQARNRKLKSIYIEALR